MIKINLKNKMKKPVRTDVMVTVPEAEEKNREATTPESVQQPQPPAEQRKRRFLERFAKKQPASELTTILKELPLNPNTVEEYFIQEPYSKVVVHSMPELGEGKAYYIIETTLNDREKETYQKLFEILSRELELPGTKVDPKTHVQKEARRLAEKYGLAKKITQDSWGRILYYIQRDLIGFGPIEAIMNDRMIEDLSVNGVGIPIYVWHRKYESMPSNLIFTDEETLSNLIIKLAHQAGKHISTAFPVLDAMLPGKDRIAATFKQEVSPKGGSFTVRRFREEPFSITDLIELGTLDEKIAAYLWLLIENRQTIVVIGGTGAGKTSALNALASLVKPSMKIVTVEEIPELNLPHENWVQLVSRESYGLGVLKAGEVSLFDLVKTSLRYRPDYIVVGEIRGEEAFVLFQAMATGHGGMCTLHGESVDYAVKRLTSPPMNVAEAYIPLINVAGIVERVQLPNRNGFKTFGRRIRTIMEVTEVGKYITISTWNPSDDHYTVEIDNSQLLRKIALRNGLAMKEVVDEVERRAVFLNQLKLKGITRNVDLARAITSYYIEPQLSKLEG